MVELVRGQAALEVECGQFLCVQLDLRVVTGENCTSRVACESCWSLFRQCMTATEPGRECMRSIKKCVHHVMHGSACMGDRENRTYGREA